MLSLNIIDQDYMCIDIATDSVIHRQLCLKSQSTCYENRDGYQSKLLNSDILPSHNLTMLDSFHISLGKPPQTEEEKEEFKYYDSKELCHMDIVPIIGDITLAPICISEKNGKKSAWIPLHPHWIGRMYALADWYELNLDQFDSFDHRCDECPVNHLHVSVANLTGKPRDNISRPEDCIIDTITA